MAEQEKGRVPTSPKDAYEPARTTSRCPKCGSGPGTHRHYPSDYGSPVDRFHCAPCDEEWWSDDQR